MQEKIFLILVIISAVILVLPGCMDNSKPPDDPILPILPTSSPVVLQSPEFHYYFGQFHSHTSYSDGMGTPAQAYVYARDKGGADFMAITDHGNYFDHDQDWTQSVEWAALKKASVTYSQDGRFIAIAGFEMSFSSATVGRGHINTFNTAWFETKNNPAMDLPGYYQKIKTYPEAILQWNHPGTIFGDFNDFSGYDPAVNRSVKLIEVGNGEGKPGTYNYHPSYQYYTRALDLGWHVAPSNNQDNHHQNWITANPCRTVVLARSLTLEEIFDAIRFLRVYASEDRNLLVSFQINGAMMGSNLPLSDSLEIAVQVTDPDPTDLIQKIELIVDGGTVDAANAFDSTTVDWSLQLPSTYHYYYLKITEADGDLAVTAPIWTGR